MDLEELTRLKRHHHKSTGTTPWHSNIGTADQPIQERLNQLAPLYGKVSIGGFGNLTGDALEVIIFKCLQQRYNANKRFAYQGYFDLTAPKNAAGRYVKTPPPKTIGERKTNKEADFLLFGYDAGAICVECKNLREWQYPHSPSIIELIQKAAELDAIPLLVARRFQYTTLKNFLEPAGILAHETLLQYYPADQAAIAARVRDKNSLGFTDVSPTEEPHPRNIRFFNEILPRIINEMADRWRKNQNVLLEYVAGEINLAQLYNAIGSRAAGNWQEPEPDEPSYEE